MAGIENTLQKYNEDAKPTIGKTIGKRNESDTSSKSLAELKKLLKILKYLIMTL